MDKEIRYLKDPTGVNKSNLIKNEKHYLTKQIKNRIIVPVEGAFFSRSVVIRDLFHNKKLDRIKDFVCGGLSSHYTKESGEEVCFFIIIHSDLISDSVEIDYQCYGGDGKFKNQSTVELLENSFVTGDRIPLAKILDLPIGFEPSFHYHDLGDIDKFEYLLFCLERIRLAVANNKTEVLNYLVDFEKMLHLLLNKTLGVFEINYHLKTKEYLDSFKKELFDLGKLRNYPLTTEAEGTKIADNSLSNVIRDHKEAYLNLLSLNAYSKKLLELLVNSRETGLGNSTELNIEANVENFEAMPIGSVFTIIDYNLAAISKNPQIDYLYPDRLDRANGYVVRKISGKSDKQTSLFLYIGRNIARVYILKLSFKNGAIVSQFTSITDDKQSIPINDMIKEHIEDYQNPHMDDKRDVKLSQVENLPIATLEDIICNLPVRKYITLRRLFSYMKRFKTGRKDTREIFEDFSERSTTKRLQTIFSPCGAWDDSMDESKIEICKVAPAREVETTTTTTTTREPIPTTTTTTTREPIPTTTTTTTSTTTSTTTTTTKPPEKNGIGGFYSKAISQSNTAEDTHINRVIFCKEELTFQDFDAFQNFSGICGNKNSADKLHIYFKIGNYGDFSGNLIDPTYVDKIKISYYNHLKTPVNSSFYALSGPNCEVKIDRITGLVDIAVDPASIPILNPGYYVGLQNGAIGIRLSGVKFYHNGYEFNSKKIVIFIHHFFMDPIYYQTNQNYPQIFSPCGTITLNGNGDFIYEIEAYLTGDYFPDD